MNDPVRVAFVCSRRPGDPHVTADSAAIRYRVFDTLSKASTQSHVSIGRIGRDMNQARNKFPQYMQGPPVRTDGRAGLDPYDLGGIFIRENGPHGILALIQQLHNGHWAMDPDLRLRIQATLVIIAQVEWRLVVPPAHVVHLPPHVPPAPPALFPWEEQDEDEEGQDDGTRRWAVVLKGLAMICLLPVLPWLHHTFWQKENIQNKTSIIASQRNQHHPLIFAPAARNDPGKYVHNRNQAYPFPLGSILLQRHGLIPTTTVSSEKVPDVFQLAQRLGMISDVEYSANELTLSPVNNSNVLSDLSSNSSSKLTPEQFFNVLFWEPSPPVNNNNVVSVITVNNSSARMTPEHFFEILFGDWPSSYPADNTCPIIFVDPLFNGSLYESTSLVLFWDPSFLTSFPPPPSYESPLFSWDKACIAIILSFVVFSFRCGQSYQAPLDRNKAVRNFRQRIAVANRRAAVMPEIRDAGRAANVQRQERANHRVAMVAIMPEIRIAWRAMNIQRQERATGQYNHNFPSFRGRNFTIHKKRMARRNERLALAPINRSLGKDQTQENLLRQESEEDKENFVPN